MPTGYTAAIEDGKITTGRDFIMRCTRAFGVAIELRDEPLSVETPIEFKPDDYHLKALAIAKEELKKVKSLTPELARDMMISEHDEIVNSAKKSIAEYNEILTRYKKVRNEIENWNPPASHENIKKFALGQIDMCIPDCIGGIEYFEKMLNKQLDLSEEGVAEYIAAQIENAEWLLNYHKDHYDNEVKNAEEKTEYMRLLLESLEGI